MSYAQQAINNLDQTINSFKSRVDVKVSDVSISTASIQATTDKIYENIERFKNDLMHGEESQIAHENILRIDQIIKEQFSNYIAIRRTVMGVVRDFDINLVRNSTIQELSEELWITSSRYWLSYTLIAITAWVNNYPEVAKNALAESGRKDAIKTTLFFCLMNLRFGRMDAAKKWFYEYFKTLDPTTLQQETAILLQSFLNGIFGKDKELEQEIIRLINEWISIINDHEQISSELLSAYETYINNLNAPVKFSYESVLQYCVNSGELEHSYKDVSKFEMLLQFVKSLDVDAEPQDNSNYKSRIDAILINLISNYDAEELELKKQQEYYRCIIENGGDIAQAEAQFQAIEELGDNEFNIGKQMLKMVCRVCLYWPAHGIAVLLNSVHCGVLFFTFSFYHYYSFLSIVFRKFFRKITLKVLKTERQRRASIARRCRSIFTGQPCSRVNHTSAGELRNGLLLP